LVSESTGASGSGVVVTRDGLVLTAAHVVQGAEEMVVLFPDGKQARGKVLGANYTRDAAMVQIKEGGNWPFVGRGESGKLEIGAWVVALGHSAGFDPARTPPVRFGRVVAKGPGTFLTTDCTLIGGDSGGPLFDLQGRVVGIHSSIGGALNNNNHSGIDSFQEDWDRLLAGDVWGRLSLNPFANPDFPVLGIVMGLGGDGVPVEEVVPGSPAAKAGLRAGDLVTALDGQAIRKGQDLQLALARRKAGEAVEVSVVRGERTLKVKVGLVRRGDFYETE
jgi:serine protease Do